MKLIYKSSLLFFAILTVLCCANSNDNKNNIAKEVAQVKCDSAIYFKYDSLLKATSKTIDSLKSKNKEQKDKLFLANYKVEKVKYYIKIVERKPSQKPFFFGWTRRAVK